MKKTYVYLFTALLVTMMSFGLTACGDDEDDGGSGGGNAAAVVDGKSYNLSHGWWDVYGDGNYKHLYLEFANVDIYNIKSPNGRVEELSLEFIGHYQYSDVQPGKYQAEMSFVDWEFQGKYDDTEIQTCLKGNVEVDIAKDGDKFTVTIPETTVDVLNDERSHKVIGTAPFSFKYTGRLAASPDDE
jgi:hypothetical protein